MKCKSVFVCFLFLSLFACGDNLPGGDIKDINDCEDCHVGIETSHSEEVLPLLVQPTCSFCHGGKQDGTSKEEAHVAVPSNWEEIQGPRNVPTPYGYIKDFAPDQLAALDPAYLQFINPSDIRIVDRTCGTCHPENAATMPNSVMVTNAGHYYPTLYLAGIQNDTLAEYGSYPASAEQCDESEGSVCDLKTLTPPTAEEITAAVASGDSAKILKMAYGHYLSKNCNTCHQAGYPRNNSPGLFRSTGCASCHMLYNTEGTYEGADPMIPKQTPVHTSSHQLTTAITTEQCATCHFQGGRIGLTFRGIREGGFRGQEPANGKAINSALYGHSPPFYYTDEDTTNDVDETPPDLHQAAGMVCVDCHVGSDVHGTASIFSSSKQEYDIRCEDCHGTIREAAKPDANGFYLTAKGRPLKQLKTKADGSVYLVGRVDGQEHVVPQPSQILAAGGSNAMHVAMGEDELGFSHADKLTCDTCHTSWTLKCMGCHVSVDLRADQKDYQTGLTGPGRTSGSRSFYSLDTILLATTMDGRVQSAAPSQQVQMAVIGAERFGSVEGEVLIGETVPDGNGGTKVIGEFRHGDGSREANIGFLPFFQHTTSRAPRKCSSCHRTEDSAAETKRVRGVYGFGTGEYLLEGAGGVTVDGLQFLDENGNEIVDWVYPDTGPVAPAIRTRAIDLVLTPEQQAL